MPLWRRVLRLAPLRPDMRDHTSALYCPWHHPVQLPSNRCSAFQLRDQFVGMFRHRRDGNNIAEPRRTVCIELPHTDRVRTGGKPARHDHTRRRPAPEIGILRPRTRNLREQARIPRHCGAGPNRNFENRALLKHQWLSPSDQRLVLNPVPYVVGPCPPRRSSRWRYSHSAFGSVRHVVGMID